MALTIFCAGTESDDLLQADCGLYTQKVELLTYAHENDVAIIKPFMLVIARDTTHAAQLLELMESAAFFEDRYKGKIIQVDSSILREQLPPAKPY